MRIGCPRERKTDEFRVALTPEGAAELVRDGHEVRVETGAGAGAGFGDEAYVAAGAEVAPDLAAVYAAELVVKVKEPVAEEYSLLREATALFCYLHLAAVPELAKVLVRERVTAIAFETIAAPGGTLPLLAPMSMVAGRLAVQVGATTLQKDHGGKGVLLSGLPGVPPAHVVIFGGGSVGQSALRVAVGMGARVTLVDINPGVLARIDAAYPGRIETLAGPHDWIEKAVADADLLIGAVLVPGALAPKVVTRKMIAAMSPGSVAVDVSVDQGGCFETTRATTHRHPTYVEEGVVHYAVANMPSLTARTSTLGLANATFPVLRRLAADFEETLHDPYVHEGLTTRAGVIVHPRVAEALRGLTD